jgi:death-on-curing protein
VKDPVWIDRLIIEAIHSDQVLVGLASSHPFNDGNKRIAFLAMYVFLGLNGLEIEADETEVVDLVVAVASGRCDEEDLADWLRSHVSPLKD